MKKYGKYYVTIGLEIHVALQTRTKLFSRSENLFESDVFALLDAGTPGVLPVLADLPVKMAVAFALSTEASVERYSEFERKHYFYPDLPLGYQITQQHKPIMIGGRVPIKTEDGEKFVQIEHAHLECDAAKSLHDKYSQYTAIDLARCSSPLLEIVSTPCMHTPEEAKEYAKTVHGLAVFLGICDGKMEEGSFRVDASISLHTELGKLGTRVENKNISSFSFLEAALYYEIERQTEILNSGGEVVMETRLFDEASMTTKSMRLKETVDEYRYMPDPDIVPLYLEEDFITQVSLEFPVDYFKLKTQLTEVLQSYQLESDDSFVTQLVSSPYRHIWYKIAFGEIPHTEKLLRLLAYWLPEVLGKVSSSRELELADILLLEKGQLQAKEIKEALLKWFGSALSLTECLPQFMSEEELDSLVKITLTGFPDQVAKYKNGETKIIQFLVGKVMGEVKGKAPATLVRAQVEKYLQ